MNNKRCVLHVTYWNEYNVKNLTSSQLRASLVPAAAVIPAQLVYAKVVASKSLVVGFWERHNQAGRPARIGVCCPRALIGLLVCGPSLLT